MPQSSTPPPNASLNLKGNYKEDDEPVNGYRLKRFIGQGSFGTVWEATAPGQARAALKIIPLTGKQGKKEFRGMSWVKKIKHPYLVPIQALFLKDQHGELIEDWEGSVGLGSTSEVAESPDSLQEDAKRPREMIIVMGLGDKSLRDRLKECRDEGLTNIPAKELLRYIKDVAGAVDFLNSPVHDLGDGQSESIIHRDVKPQNIMLAGDSAQLSDFGLARPLSKHSIAASRGVGAALAYAAPETLKENSPTTKTDQYSLAITYYKLRTGKLPFTNRSTDWDMIMAHVQGKLDFQDLPKLEENVLRRATAVDPLDRYPTALEMVEELEDAVFEGEDDDFDESGPLPSTLVPDPPRKEPEPLEFKPLASGDSIGFGYSLAERIVAAGPDEIWIATSPGTQRLVGLIVRDLQGASDGVDFDALNLCGSIEHPSLTEIEKYWLVDVRGETLNDQFQQHLESSNAARLAMVGRLAESNLQARVEECQQSSGRGIPLKELFDYLKQLTRALDLLNLPRHQYEGRKVLVQHQNVCPVNMVLDEGRVRLGNFSYARLLDSPKTPVSNANWIPKHSFAAPEILKGELTLWSDLYSLALSYLYLRTGEPPFGLLEPTSAVQQRMLSGEIDMSGLSSPAEAAVIAQATNLNPQKRFPNCETFLKKLYEALKSSGSPKPPQQQPVQQQPSQQQPVQQQPRSEPALADDLSTQHLPRIQDAMAASEPQPVPSQPVQAQPPDSQPAPSLAVSEPRPTEPPASSGSSGTEATEGQVALMPGRRVGPQPGYELKRRVFSTQRDELWTAVSLRKGLPATVLFRNLRADNVGVDVGALDACRRLRHPHTTAVEEVWLIDSLGSEIETNLRDRVQSGGLAFLAVAETSGGKTLGDRLKERLDEGARGLPAKELLDYLWQLAEAFDYLNSSEHRRREDVVALRHQNLHPRHVLLDDDGCIRLGGFAYVRATPSELEDAAGRDWIPSHDFAAPEVFEGRVVESSDQYSLALLFIHLRFGDVAFVETPDQPWKIPDLSVFEDQPDEIYAVSRATADYPDSRFSSCREFVTEVAKASGISAAELAEQAARFHTDPLRETEDPPADAESEMTPPPPPPVVQTGSDSGDQEALPSGDPPEMATRVEPSDSGDSPILQSDDVVYSDQIVQNDEVVESTSLNQQGEPVVPDLASQEEIRGTVIRQEDFAETPPQDLEPSDSGEAVSDVADEGVSLDPPMDSGGLSSKRLSDIVAGINDDVEDTDDSDQGVESNVLDDAPVDEHGSSIWVGGWGGIFPGQDQFDSVTENFGPSILPTETATGLPDELEPQPPVAEQPQAPQPPAAEHPAFSSKIDIRETSIPQQINVPLVQEESKSDAAPSPATEAAANDAAGLQKQIEEVWKGAWTRSAPMYAQLSAALPDKESKTAALKNAEHCWNTLMQTYPEDPEMWRWRHQLGKFYLLLLENLSEDETYDGRTYDQIWEHAERILEEAKGLLPRKDPNRKQVIKDIDHLNDLG